MEIAKIRVSKDSIKILKRIKVPSGLIGGTIRVEYAPGIWENLSKTVVFKGVTTKDVLTNQTTVKIPPETIAEPGKRLQVGFYGVDVDENMIIPTLWCDLGQILPGTDPSGDESTDPSLPVWAQLEGHVRKYTDMVDALNEDIEGTVASSVQEYLKENPPSGGVDFETDETLTMKDGVLSVNTEAINVVSDEEIARLNSIMV